MNVNQYMDKIVQDVATRGGNINEVHKASRETYSKHIAPKLVGQTVLERLALGK